MKKFFETIATFDWKASWPIRITCGLFLICLLAVGAIFGGKAGAEYNSQVKEATKDENVYLNEEVCYAGGIYVKVDSISVDTIEDQTNTIDKDKDMLSEYVLNLGLNIVRKGGGRWTNSVKLKSNYFSLKSVNMKSKSKMKVFIECLAKETISAAINIIVDGSVNIIGETINFISEYTAESIENATTNKNDFKPIKCKKNQFEPFKPREEEGPYKINISFPIKQKYLESENLIVLCIDQITHYEQRIFLVTRPN